MSRRAVCLGIGVVGVAIVLGFGRRAPLPLALRKKRVVAHPFQRTLKVLGTLEAARSFKGFAPPEGEAILTRLVPEGTPLEKGAVIAQFDAQDHEEALLDKTIERDTVKLDLVIKREELNLEAFEVKNRVAFATEDLKVARLAQELLLTDIDESEDARLAHSLTASQRLIATLSRSIAEMQPYVAKGFVSKDDEDRQKTRLADEKLLFEALSIDRSVVSSGSLPDRRARAVLDVTTAQTALNLAREKLKSFERRRIDSIGEIEARLQGLEEEAAFLKDQISRHTVRTPVEGVVLYGTTSTESGREQKVREGMHLRGGLKFVEVASPGQVDLEMEINEAYTPFIREGMALSFRVTAHPSATFSARLTQVSAALAGLGLGAWYYSEERTLTARAHIPYRDKRLMPGMTAMVDLIVEERPRALWIDADCLDQSRVHLAKGGQRKVRTGYVGLREVEVLAGLVEGEEVFSLVEPSTQGPPSDSVLVKAIRKDLPLSFSGNGTLTPEKIYEIFPREIDGETVIETMVADGTWVKKGQTIAHLDEQALSSRLQEKRLYLSVTEKDRKVVLEQSRVDLETLKQAADVADLDERVAILDDTLIELGKAPLELENLAIGLHVTEAEIALIEKKLSLKRGLSSKGYVSEEEVKTLEQELLNREVNLAVARVKLALARRGATPVERQKVKASRERARINRELASARLSSRKRKRDLESARSDLALKRARAALDRYLRMVAECTVVAPASGTVVRNDRQSPGVGMRKFQEGDPVRKGITFLQVANLDRFRIKGTVPEERISSLSVAQPVRFSLTSFPAASYSGKVDLIGRVAREKGEGIYWFIPQLDRVFDLDITAAESHPRFQPGLSVQFEVETGRLSNVLTIPIDAVHHDADGPYVFVSSGSKRRINVGEESGGDVSVISSLTEGESVLVVRSGH